MSFDSDAQGESAVAFDHGAVHSFEPRWEDAPAVPARIVPASPNDRSTRPRGMSTVTKSRTQQCALPVDRKSVV